LSPAFDPAAPYELSERVGLRPEPFGALAYHFDTRRLVFLKTPALVDLVRSLGEHPSVTDAVAAAAPDPPGQRRFTAALRSLADSDIIRAR
jgi:putative mycofactocin binding protein MftB